MIQDISSEIAAIFKNAHKTQDDVIGIKVEYVLVDGKKVYDLDAMRKQLELKMKVLK